MKRPQVLVPTRLEFEYAGEDETKPPADGVPMNLFVAGDRVGVIDDSGNRWLVKREDVERLLQRTG